MTSEVTKARLIRAVTAELLAARVGWRHARYWLKSSGDTREAIVRVEDAKADATLAVKAMLDMPGVTIAEPSSDEVFLLDLVEANGYPAGKLLGDNRFACIFSEFNPMIISGPVGETFGYSHGWFYETFEEAQTALDAWQPGQPEPPPRTRTSDGWIRHIPSNRRVSRTGHEIDDEGNAVSGVGVIYVMR